MTDRGHLSLKTQVIKDLEAENERLRGRIRRMRDRVRTTENHRDQCQCWVCSEP